MHFSRQQVQELFGLSYSQISNGARRGQLPRKHKYNYDDLLHIGRWCRRADEKTFTFSAAAREISVCEWELRTRMHKIKAAGIGQCVAGKWRFSRADLSKLKTLCKVRYSPRTKLAQNGVYSIVTAAAELLVPLISFRYHLERKNILAPTHVVSGIPNPVYTATDLLRLKEFFASNRGDRRSWRRIAVEQGLWSKKRLSETCHVNVSTITAAIKAQKIPSPTIKSGPTLIYTTQDAQKVIEYFRERGISPPRGRGQRERGAGR